MDVAEKILQIPLVETAHEDFQVWRGEPIGEFSVRSPYKLLHKPSLDPNIVLTCKYRLSSFALSHEK
ncbi:hypothetical protein Golob_026820 [Gossypium lobatum]|uniref:Uncharacterized protein n=1 Tax=Gossypium lobatum TaxID=34289 RepID=A0A7J8LWH3_9ROSI|nr:hypothetical protein [Gossypium lobatum]